MRRGEKKVTSVTRHADKNKKQEEMLSGKIKATPLADITENRKLPTTLRYKKKIAMDAQINLLHLLKGKWHRTCPMSHRAPPSGWRTIRRTLRARHEWFRHTLTAPLWCKIRSGCAYTACLSAGVAAPFAQSVLTAP
jgi:hypothetical protein